MSATNTHQPNHQYMREKLMTCNNSITLKPCSKCRIDKPLSEFGIHKIEKDGLNSSCKKCSTLRVKKKSRTKDGLIQTIFSHQLDNSRRRGHVKPEYNLCDLKDWALNQRIFHNIYNCWVSSGYSKDLIPSFDRTDDYLGYSLDRLTIMTWKDNRNKASNDRRNGVNNKHSKAVIQMNLSGEIIRKHHSINHASRETGCNLSGISSCCNGKCKSSGGFKWIYVP